MHARVELELDACMRADVDRACMLPGGAVNIVVRKVSAADWTRARIVFWRWCKANGRSRDDVGAWQDFLALLVLRSIGDLEHVQFADAPRGAGRFV